MRTSGLRCQKRNAVRHVIGARSGEAGGTQTVFSLSLQGIKMYQRWQTKQGPRTC